MIYLRLFFNFIKIEIESMQIVANCSIVNYDDNNWWYITKSYFTEDYFLIFKLNHLESDDVALLPEIGISVNSRFILEYCAHHGTLQVLPFGFMAAFLKAIEHRLYAGNKYELIDQHSGMNIANITCGTPNSYSTSIGSSWWWIRGVSMASLTFCWNHNVSIIVWKKEWI